MKKTNKIIALFLALALMISCFVSVPASAAIKVDWDEVFAAAEEYVKTYKNEVTAEGLKNAVVAASEVVDLEIDDESSNFYIKHAVNGVKDDTTDYPLNIEGSDGAVVARFSDGSETKLFTCAFKHNVETIHITKTAVVSKTDSDFSFDADGNVTAYTGDADKIVFPKDFNGSMRPSVDLTKASSTWNVANTKVENNVKVIIYNNVDKTNSAFYPLAFAGWQSLVAVQMADSTAALGMKIAAGVGTTNGGGDKKSQESYMFAYCPNLKYFRFPNVIYSNGNSPCAIFPEHMFDSSVNLETIIMPTGKSTASRNYSNYGWHSFYNIAVREILFPDFSKNANYNYDTAYESAGFNKVSYKNGTRNVILSTDNMTGLRAIALAVAAVNELSGDAVTEENVKSVAKGAVKGAANAATVADAMSFAYSGSASDTALNIELTITYDGESVTFTKNAAYALDDINISGYTLNPAFDPSVLEYQINETVKENVLDVTPVLADGAQLVSIIGDKSIKDGANEIVITVTTAVSKTVVYKVTCDANINMAEDVAALKAAADAYVEEKQNAVEPQGLLDAINAVLKSSVTYYNENGNDAFFIKHSVPGVVDNDYSEYHLDIAGSNGAVSATFAYGSEKISYNKTFGFETEVIEVETFAIAGDSDYNDYLDYDQGGNIVDVKKPVDKLILPEGFTATVNKLSGDSLINADTVKVLIINNCVGNTTVASSGTTFIKDKAFSGWKGLTAVQFAEGNYQILNAHNDQMQQFYGCSNLKYVKLPTTVKNRGFGRVLTSNLFKDCTELENVNIPEFAYDSGKLKMAVDAFAYTKVRDFFLTKNIEKDETYDANTFKSLTNGVGTTNLIYYTDAMTFERATALIAATYNNAKSVQNIKNAAPNAIVGSSDAASYKGNLTYDWQQTSTNGYAISGILTVSDAISGKSVDIALTYGNALADLYVKDSAYKFEENFDIANGTYTVKLPYTVNTLKVSYKAGYTTSVYVDKELEIKNDKASFNVSCKSGGGSVAYTVNVERYIAYNADTLAELVKYLLGTGSVKMDVNKDNSYDILDLVSFKKRLASVANSGKKDAEEIIKQPISSDGITTETMLSAVAYYDKDGKITDTLFDGVIFTIPKNDLLSYADNGVGTPKQYSKRDMSNYIYNGLFKNGYNLDAYDEAVGIVKSELMMSDYVACVYLPIPLPIGSDWGSINGVEVDTTTTAGQLTAVKWVIDEEIKAFNAQKYENIKLCGFYYVDERFRGTDTNFLSDMNAYIHTKNLTSVWAPFYNAEGYNLWEDRGFDRAFYQSNYFPGNETLDNNGGIQRLAATSTLANTNNAYLEMELCNMLEVSYNGLLAYFDNAAKAGLMDAPHTWWLVKNIDTLTVLRDSSVAAERNLYDSIYAFIKGTYTAAK